MRILYPVVACCTVISFFGACAVNRLPPQTSYGRPVFVSLNANGGVYVNCGMQEKDSNYDPQALSDITFGCADTNLPCKLSDHYVEKNKFIQVVGPQKARLSQVAGTLRAAGYTNFIVKQIR